MIPVDVDPFRDSALPELDAVRSGEELDWEVIAEYLRQKLPPEIDTSGSFRVLQFPNGSANLTYMIAFGSHELVFRRPPFGSLAPGAHDMRREYKVLSRLWQHFALAPRAYVFCDDHAVAGADFLVMKRCRGEVVRGVIPSTMRRHADVGQRIGFALVDAMARFHRVEPGGSRLDDLGRPEGFVMRQLQGWKKRWDLVADAQYTSSMTDIFDELVATMPSPQRVSLVHNDLKLDNCMFDPDDPDRVVAIFDWDMTTLGDPLIDLGTLLNYWPDPKDDSSIVGLAHAGMERMGLASRREVIARYGELSGMDVSHADWYAAFARWKTATVVQQLHHRWAVGDSTDERMATVAEGIGGLIGGAEMFLTADKSG
ncbi:MAG: phosphotransferase family protein [Pseudomonadales bacterium]|nr:phosphotransferase family protein [Pseudomonadales bacterium]